MSAVPGMTARRTLFAIGASLLLGAAKPTPVATPLPPLAWEPAARELAAARRTAEAALARVADGARADAPAARAALDALLAAADRYQKEAEAITPRLLAPGMPPAANARHEAFLASHRARRGQLAAVAPALAGADPVAAAKDALAILAEASPGAPRDALSSIAVRHVRRLSPRDANADWSDLDDVRIDGAPQPRDLHVAKAPEVAFRADATPAQIAAWLRAEIEVVPFHASALGGAGCLRDRRCSAWDAAAALAEVLRARNVPARIAYGTVECDAASLAQRLLGGGTRQELIDALHLGGVPAVESGAARVRLEHAWVRAHAGGAWIDLDPVLDPRPGTVAVPASAPLKAAATDPASLLVRYLSDPSERTPIGADFLPPLPRATPIPTPAKKAGPAPKGTRPAPAAPSIVYRAGELAAIPPAHRSVVGLAAGRAGEPPWVDVQIPLEEAQATGILFYAAAPSDLENRIAKALAPTRPPPHLSIATTRISAGGREIAALPPLAWGTSVSLTITLYPPNGTPLDVHGAIHVGAPAALTVAPHAIGTGTLPARWKLADADPTGASGVARFLAATGAQFFADLLDESARLAARAGGRRFLSPSTVLVAGALEAPSGLARPPLHADAAGIVVDVGRLDQLLLPGPASQPVAFEVSSGAALSAWESRALEIATGITSVSTVTAAKAASASGGAPRILRGSVPAAELGGLSHYARSEIRRGLATGLVAVIPRVPPSLGGWAGEAYVLLDPRSGRGAYLLRGGLRGAITTDRCAALLDALRDGGDAGATLAKWRRGRAERALLAREGWPSGARAGKTAGVEKLVAVSAAREAASALPVGPWPPVGGKAKLLARGEPISLSKVGAVLWMGRSSRVLDPAVVKTLGAKPPKGFDPKTRLWVGPTALAIVPVDGEGRLLPVPAPY